MPRLGRSLALPSARSNPDPYKVWRNGLATSEYWKTAMKDFNTAFLNSVSLHSIACNGYRRAARQMKEAEAAGNGVGLEGSLVAIIFSAASLEAFSAEIPFMIDMVKAGYPSLVKLGAVLDDAENSKVQVTGKYLIAKSILGEGFDRGANPYQDFSLLVRIRNAIIHMKPDVVGDDPHKLVVGLQNRGLCDPNEAPNNSWMDQIATVPVAMWACNTATAMMRGLCRNADGVHISLLG
jgi:hypothetical protein